MLDLINSFFADPQTVLTGLFVNNLTLACVIVFIWCMLEGELALILAGLAAHGEHIHVGVIIFIAGCGGFMGDQIYFYIGRSGKGLIRKKLAKQRRKFAVASVLLNRYGWPIIFLQRYMYGFRTIIPMSIGLTGYCQRKFALINFISAQIWAAATILLVWYFGDAIWAVIDWASTHWYLAAFAVAAFLCVIVYAFKNIEKRLLKKKGKRCDLTI